MKRLASFLLMLGICASLKAQITVNGVMDEPQWQIIGVENGNNGFGSQNNLGVLKYYSDASTLYIGITGILETSATVRNNIVLFIDCDFYDGVDWNNTLSGGIASSLGVFITSPATCGAFGGLAGSRMDNDFDLDYAFAFNKGYSLNQFFLDGMRFGNSPQGYFQEQFIGATPAPNGQNGDPFVGAVPAWTGSGNLSFAYKDGFDAINFPLYGIELAIPYSVTPGIQAGKRARFFVLITNTDGFGSNECIPGDPNIIGDPGPASNLGCSFDLSTIINPGNDIFYTQPWQILPLSFLGTNVKWQNKLPLLQWSVAQDYEATQYTVERSANGISFAPIATVPAKRLRDIATYSFIDESPLPGKNVYRIKATGPNGLNKISPVVKLENNFTGGLAVFPNPAKDQLILRLQDIPAGTLQLQLFNAAGQVVLRRALPYDGSSRSSSISLPAMAKGLYMLQVTSGSNTISRQKVMIE